MTLSRVYLAGPITGQTYDGCVEWRDYARQYLLQKDILGVSPMRGKDYLRSDHRAIRDGYDASVSALCTPKGITTRDRWDCQRADVVLMNLLGSERISVGSMIEVGWADAARRPIVAVMEGSSNRHWHSMVLECAGFVLTTLDAALEIIAAILTPHAIGVE